MPVQGLPARQYDAFDMGITTTDVFGAADVLYDRTLPAVRAALTLAPAGQPHVPVVTGFLGRGASTGQGGLLLSLLGFLENCCLSSGEMRTALVLAL